MRLLAGYIRGGWQDGGAGLVTPLGGVSGDGMGAVATTTA
jgi:hypothetical protein